MTEQSSTRIGWTRIGIGLGQGIALYGLHWASRTPDTYAFNNSHLTPFWPATVPWLYAALTFAVLFGPLILMAGIGGLRRGALAVWLAVGTFAAAGVATYDILRDSGGDSRLLPQPHVFFAVAAALFIAHHLIASGDAARRWIAPYPSYFDVAWKHAVQVILSLVFVGVFWLVLTLGAALFEVIGLKFLKELLEKSWFYIPAPTVAFACAVHLTDVRAGLTRGARTLALNLLSWLMPLMGLIAIGFLFALPFTGLAPLWRVGHSTASLLTAIAMLVLLLNAAYQDGSDETRAPTVLRWAGRATALTLAPLAAIATYGLWLRLSQHGLTPERIIAAACVIVAASYAAGYAMAALRLDSWMKPLERANIISAYVILVVVLALFTPLADPARISVADQVRRLNDGRIAADKFDYEFLRFNAAGYGRDALRTLAARTSGPGAAVIAAKAQATQKLQHPTLWNVARLELMNAEQINVFPKGRSLPPSFLRQKFEDFGDTCLNNEKCEAYFADVDGDGEAEILLAHGTYRISIFKHAPNDSWRSLGVVPLGGCPDAASILQNLRDGKIGMVEPQLKDIEVAGRRLRVATNDTCPPVNTAQPSATPNASK